MKLRVMPDTMDLGQHMASCVGQAIYNWEDWKDGGSPKLSDRMVMGYRLPSWQRPFVWSSDQKIKLIESIWLGLNVGTYTFNRVRLEGSKFDNLLIDGQQRMKALEEYLSNAFPVFGYFWDDTTKIDRRGFKNSRHFHCYITTSSDEAYLRNYYNMVNFGGVAHTEDQKA